MPNVMPMSVVRATGVEDFVAFLKMRDEERHLIHVASNLSENVFRKVWDNPDDAEYDGYKFGDTSSFSSPSPIRRPRRSDQG